MTHFYRRHRRAFPSRGRPFLLIVNQRSQFAPMTIDFGGAAACHSDTFKKSLPRMIFQSF